MIPDYTASERRLIVAAIVGLLLGAVLIAAALTDAPCRSDAIHCRMP